MHIHWSVGHTCTRHSSVCEADKSIPFMGLLHIWFTVYGETEQCSEHRCNACCGLLIHMIRSLKTILAEQTRALNCPFPRSRTFVGLASQTVQHWRQHQVKENLLSTCTEFTDFHLLMEVRFSLLVRKENIRASENNIKQTVTTLGVITRQTDRQICSFREWTKFL